MESLSIYDNGVMFSTGKVSCANKTPSVKRGGIKSFSYSSRLRLRSFLLCWHVPERERFCITLTLPWHMDSWSSVMDDFKNVVHRFRVSWLRLFPGDGLVYRVELQRRGAPHLHIVAFHSECSLSDLHDKYFLLWHRALQSDLRGGDYYYFYKHGVKVEAVKSNVAVIRYMCDHASKSKQAQLGYLGKQWGVLGRVNFRKNDSESFVFPREFDIFLRRHLSKAVRFRVKSKCVFGFRLSHRRRLSKVVYVNGALVKRLYDYWSSLHPAPF